MYVLIGCPIRKTATKRFDGKHSIYHIREYNPRSIYVSCSEQTFKLIPAFLPSGFDYPQHSPLKQPTQCTRTCPTEDITVLLNRQAIRNLGSRDLREWVDE